MSVVCPLAASEPFPQDLAIVGRMEITLFVSSNRTDTDFTVKVTDVYPFGLEGEPSILIGDSIMRMRWREGSRHRSSMTPGNVYRISISMVWLTCKAAIAMDAFRAAATAFFAILISHNPPQPVKALT